MTESLQRYLSAGVLTIWGVMLAYFCFSGRVASYLHPSFHVWTGISGVILVLLAAGLLFLADGEDPCCEGCDHSHEAPSPLRSVLTALVLVVPLLVAATVSPDQFGAATVTNRGFIERINDLPSYKPSVEPLLPAADGSQRRPGLRARLRAICQGTKRARSKRKPWIFSTLRKSRQCAPTSKIRRLN